jgi:hypothetical protein
MTERSEQSAVAEVGSEPLFCTAPNYSDGQEWDCQCARCGSSLEREPCWNCGGEGLSHHDCGEDCCCCLYPEDNVRCDVCDGEGGWWQCLSSHEFCQANPLPGHEDVESGTPEWYAIPRVQNAQISGGTPSAESDCSASDGGKA